MIQIIGTKKKCKDTAKAIRSCKERSIAFQFVDLGQRTLSDGSGVHFLAPIPQKICSMKQVHTLQKKDMRGEAMTQLRS